MKKGLSILLEQPDGHAPARRQSTPSSSAPSPSTQKQSSRDRSGEEQKRKKELENAMMAMFEKFRVQDRDSERNLVEKLTTRDKELIVKDCFDALISKYKGILNIDSEIVDDTVVENTIIYMINERKMDPFKIIYKSPLVLHSIIKESIGLEKILFEQGVRVSTNTIYINYTNPSARDDKFELISGLRAERIALDSYNKRTGQEKFIENKPKNTPEPTPRPKQTSEVNEVRPEVEMKIETPKIMKKQLNNEKS